MTKSHQMRQFSAPAVATAVLVLALGGTSSSAMAEGPYIWLGGGVNSIEDAEATGNDGTYGANGEVRFDSGFRVGGALGYRFSHFRIEAEGGYGRNDLDAVYVDVTNGVQAGATDVGGTADLISGGVNFLVDLPRLGEFRPYIGGGVHYTPVKLGELEATLAGQTFSIDGDDTETLITGVATAGIAYPITDNVELTADYRYARALGDPRFEDDNSGGFVELEYAAHTFGLGLRYNFNPPGGGGKDSNAGADLAPPPAASAQSAPVTFPDDGPTSSSDLLAMPDSGDPFAQANGNGGNPAGNAQPALTPPLSPPAPPQSAAGGFGVQIGAFQDQANAEDGWTAFARRHPDVAGRATRLVRRETVPGKGPLYRLYAGGLDRQSANSLCRRLK